ncbi:GATA transcription factor 16-like isoform X1 [Actinidia eriantha]|uniref:GATA transcription factor 16-like isoform X1 n=1 Tax=Actinidia eriantha TaxID=165200 RepID=UPI00258F33D8|nr:GATA transcription factor 16-like isoform X1 [Actinidia eriantha]
MVDLSDKGSESEERNNGQRPDSVKTCADCGTNKTPLWRGGPAGPKSLCNACGIRSRKKRRALLGVNKGSTEEDKKLKNSIKNNHKGKLGNTLRRKLLALGKEVVVQRSMVEKLRRKLGEEEQAAVLLMALSCGSVFA